MTTPTHNEIMAAFRRGPKGRTVLSLLDDLPIATLAFIAGAVGSIIALATGSIDYQAFLIGLGAFGGGTGALGYARAQSGKGLRKKK